MTTTKQLRAAFILAEKHHRRQNYGRELYLSHLFDVTSVLSEFGHRSNLLLAAGWLHDIIEDTSVNYHTVADVAGAEVAEIVYAVTDELGRNRKERKARSLPKLIKNDNAILVKLSDRIANARDAYVNRRELFEMYRAGYNDFKTAIYYENTRSAAMWLTLDRLLGGKS